MGLANSIGEQVKITGEGSSSDCVVGVQLENGLDIMGVTGTKNPSITNK